MGPWGNYIKPPSSPDLYYVLDLPVYGRVMTSLAAIIALACFSCLTENKTVTLPWRVICPRLPAFGNVRTSLEAIIVLALLQRLDGEFAPCLAPMCLLSYLRALEALLSFFSFLIRTVSRSHRRVDHCTCTYICSPYMTSNQDAFLHIFAVASSSPPACLLPSVRLATVPRGSLWSPKCPPAGVE
jgi:hypothetical protein